MPESDASNPDAMLWFYAALATLAVNMPIALLLAWKAPREHGGWLGALWDRWLAPRLHPMSSRLLSPAVFCGIAAGALAALCSATLNHALFPGVSLARQPESPMQLTLQIAFVQAGAIEEISKILLAAAVVPLAVWRRGALLSSAPFLFGAAGVGFALVEDLLYLRYYSAASPVGMLLARSLPVHCLINFAFGLRLIDSTHGGVAWRFFSGLILAILWHGIYDFFALPPVPFAQMLAFAVFLLISVWTLRRFAALYPDRLERTLRPVEEEEWREWRVSLPPRLRSRGTAPSVGGFPEMPPIPELAAGYQAVDRSLARALEAAPPPSEEFAEQFTKHNWAARFVAGQAPPESDYAILGGALQRCIFAADHRRPAPLHLADEWSRAEAIWSLRIFGHGAPTRIWDSAALGDTETELDQIYAEAAAIGADLAQLSPFRLLEYDLDGRCVYLSIGLNKLYGRELLCSWPHPMPAVRLLYLWLACFPPEQALWLREFSAFLADQSLQLGEPRNWLRTLVITPCLEPSLRIYAGRGSLGALLDLDDQTRESAPPLSGPPLSAGEELPLQALLFCQRDGWALSTMGFEAFFGELLRREYSWNNDLRRPSLA